MDSCRIVRFPATCVASDTLQELSLTETWLADVLRIFGAASILKNVDLSCNPNLALSAAGRGQCGAAAGRQGQGRSPRRVAGINLEFKEKRSGSLSAGLTIVDSLSSCTM